MHVSRGAALPHHHWLATCPNFPISGCGHATRPKARATLPTQPLTTPAGTQPPSWPPHLPQWCRSCPAQAAAAGSRAGSAAGGRERRRRCPAPHLAACCPPAAVVGGLGGWSVGGWVDGGWVGSYDVAARVVDNISLSKCNTWHVHCWRHGHSSQAGHQLRLATNPPAPVEPLCPRWPAAAPRGLPAQTRFLVPWRHSAAGSGQGRWQQPVAGDGELRWGGRAESGGCGTMAMHSHSKHPCASSPARPRPDPPAAGAPVAAPPLATGPRRAVAPRQPRRDAASQHRTAARQAQLHSGAASEGLPAAAGPPPAPRRHLQVQQQCSQRINALGRHLGQLCNARPSLVAAGMWVQWCAAVNS